MVTFPKITGCKLALGMLSSPGTKSLCARVEASGETQSAMLVNWKV